MTGRSTPSQAGAAAGKNGGRAPIHVQTQGYHTAVIAHDPFFPHQVRAGGVVPGAPSITSSPPPPCAHPPPTLRPAGPLARRPRRGGAPAAAEAGEAAPAAGRGADGGEWPNPTRWGVACT